MIRLTSIRQEIDFRHLPAFLLCVVCFYFTYHLLAGERSIWSYLSNQQIITDKKAHLSALEDARDIQAKEIERLRLSTLDSDFLEERARYLLGYIGENEIMMVSP